MRYLLDTARIYIADYMQTRRFRHGLDQRATHALFHPGKPDGR